MLLGNSHSILPRAEEAQLIWDTIPSGRHVSVAQSTTCVCARARGCICVCVAWMRDHRVTGRTWHVRE